MALGEEEDRGNRNDPLNDPLRHIDQRTGDWRLGAVQNRGGG